MVKQHCCENIGPGKPKCNCFCIKRSFGKPGSGGSAVLWVKGVYPIWVKGYCCENIALGKIIPSTLPFLWTLFLPRPPPSCPGNNNTPSPKDGFRGNSPLLAKLVGVSATLYALPYYLITHHYGDAFRPPPQQWGPPLAAPTVVYIMVGGEVNGWIKLMKHF